MFENPRLLGRMLATLVAMLFVVGSAGAETLNHALADAWQHNPRMLAARAGAGAAHIDVQTAKRGWYPKLGINAQLARTHTEGTIAMFGAPSDFDAGLDQASVALRVQQPLYQGGRLRSEIAASESAAKASQARLAARGSQVLLDAVKAYVNVIAAQQLLQIQNDNVHVIQQELGAAQDALRHGEGTKTDVAQASSRLQAARAQRIRVRSQLAQVRATYRMVMGHPAGDLTMPTRLPELPDTLDRAKLLAQNNFRVRAAHYKANSVSQQADAVDDALMPTVGLFAEVSRANEPQFGFEDLNDETIGLSVSMPIWNGGAVRSKAAAAQRRASAARLKTAAVRDQARQRVVAAWHGFRAARAALAADKARLAAARTAADGVAAEHRYGERTLLDVLDAQQEVRNARAMVTQAHRDRMVAAYTLLATTGGLSASGLSLSVAQLGQTQ